MGGRARSSTIRTSGASIWAKGSRCRPASGASDRFPSPFSLTSKSWASFFPQPLDGVEPTSGIEGRVRERDGASGQTPSAADAGAGDDAAIDAVDQAASVDAYRA